MGAPIIEDLAAERSGDRNGGELGAMDGDSPFWSTPSSDGRALGRCGVVLEDKQRKVEGRGDGLGLEGTIRLRGVTFRRGLLPSVRDRCPSEVLENVLNARKEGKGTYAGWDTGTWTDRDVWGVDADTDADEGALVGDGRPGSSMPVDLLGDVSSE